MATIAGERWETGRGDGAGIYLAGAPATRAKIGDFSEGGRGDASEVCQARAQLAAAAPAMFGLLQLASEDPEALGLLPESPWMDLVRATLAAAEGR